MPEIPDDYYEGARMGDFPFYDAQHWLENDAPEDTREHIDEALDNNLSLEWAFMTAYHDLSADPHEWENVTISRDFEGDWAVIITEGGESHSIKFDTDDIADDMVWADLYWHLEAEGIEFDKDIDSGEAVA